MSTTRDQRIEIRVTAEEKALLVTAAGGQRELSAFLREAALSKALFVPVKEEAQILEKITPNQKALLGAAPDLISSEIIAARSAAASSPPPSAAVGGGVPPVAKTTTKKQAKQDARDQSAADRTAAATSQCPRWMHHRKGAYCGTCKTVS